MTKPTRRRIVIPPASPHTCIWPDSRARVIDSRQVVDYMEIDFGGPNPRSYSPDLDGYDLKMRWQDHYPAEGAEGDTRIPLRTEPVVYRTELGFMAAGVRPYTVTKCCLCGMVYLLYGKVGAEHRDESRVVRE